MFILYRTFVFLGIKETVFILFLEPHLYLASTSNSKIGEIMGYQFLGSNVSIIGGVSCTILIGPHTPMEDYYYLIYV
jgi:hypothetical protein